MKQRILSILCALALVAAMLPPVTASAAGPSTLTVGGTDVLSGSYWLTNADDGTLTADGASADNYNVYYDGNGTLTLDNATINGTNTTGHVGAGIFASGDLTIVLEGSSTVKGVQDPNGDSQSIRVEGNLTIQGGGSLTAQGAETSSGSSYGIFVIGSFTQQGGSVTASGGNVSGNYNSTGLYVYGSTVTVQGGTLTATGGTTGSGSYGISMFSSVTVGNATVTATGGTGKYSYGLYIDSSSPSVTLSDNGSLTARSESADKAGGIYFQNPFGSTGSVTVGENSTLLTNSVIRQDMYNTQIPLAPTGDGSWLIYGQSNQTSAVGGNYTLKENITIPEDVTLTIPAGGTLTVPTGITLTVNGTLNIANQSSLTGSGTLNGSGNFYLTNPEPVISGDTELTYDGTDHFTDFSLTAPSGTVEVLNHEFTISSSATIADWTLETQEIINAGTYTLTAKNGTRTIEKEVTVSPAEISITGATLTPKTYDGTTTATVESVTFDNLVTGESLSLGTDYTATATFADKNVGDSKSATVTVTLKGGGNYTFAQSGNTTNANGTIRPLPVVLNWDTISFTYDGSAKTVTAKVSNAVDGDTFTLTYDDNAKTDVGNYTAKVTDLGNDNYTLDGASGTEQAWSIGEASIAGAEVTLSQNSFTYDGQSHTPTVTVKLNGNALNAETDYNVDFGGDSINAGTYTVTVTGKGNYSGTATSQPTYTITKADQAALSITSSGPATFGQNFTLTTSGGSGSGSVTFTVTDGTGAATVSGNILTPSKAGTVTVTAVKAGDNNYNDGTSVSVPITINKGTYDGTKTAAGSVLANWSDKVTLPAIPAGASYGTPTYTGSDGAVAGLSITGGKLSYTGGNGIVKDQTYTVTVPVTGATNYVDYNITVTLTVTTRPSSSGGTTTPTGPSTGGSDGWTEIEDEVDETPSGSTVTVDMNGTTEVPAEVFEAVAGKDVTLELDMGGGVKWEINGQDIPTDLDFTDLDLGVSLNTSDIPVDVINMVTGEKSTVQLSLAHDGEFGFTLTLTAPVGTENKGLWASLYHYNTTKKQMLFETAAQVDSSGNVALKFTHASEYAIVLDESSHELPFTDTAKGAWYQGAVEYVYRNSIMTGTSATSFEPNAPLSRAMVAQILYNLEGQPTVEGESTFADASGHWAVNAIAWAQQTGVVNGYEDNTFRPNRTASREELAQMLYNYAKVKGYDLTASGDLTAFPDGSKVSSWAEAAMAWANGNELINGHDDGTLQPGGDSTRAQAASILMSFDLNLAN